MGLFKLDKYDKYFICFLLIILVFVNVSQVLAVETENVDYNVVNNLSIYYTRNYFNTSSSANTGYLLLEKGYIYYITKTTGSCSLATSNEVPAVNVPYNYLGELSSGDVYSYLSNSDTDYLYFCFSNDANVIVTREKIEGMNDAIGGLVDNVGISNLWGVFENGIDFVGVVVLVGFGLLLVALLIKKVSKGKSDF